MSRNFCLACFSSNRASSIVFSVSYLDFCIFFKVSCLIFCSVCLSAPAIFAASSSWASLIVLFSRFLASFTLSSIVLCISSSLFLFVSLIFFKELSNCFFISCSVRVSVSFADAISRSLVSAASLSARRASASALIRASFSSRRTFFISAFTFTGLLFIADNFILYMIITDNVYCE